LCGPKNNVNSAHNSYVIRKTVHAVQNAHHILRWKQTTDIVTKNVTMKSITADLLARERGPRSTLFCASLLHSTDNTYTFIITQYPKRGFV